MGDRRAADVAAELLRTNLPGAFKGLSVTGEFTVEPAGKVGVTTVTHRHGDIKLRYSGEMDLDIVALACDKALAGHANRKVNSRRLRGHGNDELVITWPDPELVEKERQRQAQRDERNHVAQGYASAGYGDSVLGEIGGGH